MKKRCTQLIKVIPLLLVMVASLCVKGQDSDFNFTIENDVQTARNILEFDLYVKDTDAGAIFKLSTIQAGITVNPAIYNGGAITVSILAGISDLTNTIQKPFNVLWNQSRNVIQMTPPPVPEESSASIISQTALGTRICRMRLTNTQPFTAYSQANLTFSFTSPYPYPTKIAQFLTAGQNKSTEIECHSTNCFNHSNNIVLNASPEAYNVTGSGSFCEGASGLTVTLSNSQTGIYYQLKKNGTNDGPVVTGTGMPLTWINKPAGTYTVEAANAATFITSTMAGSAVIVMNPSPMAKAGSSFGVCYGEGNQIGRAPVAGNTYSWTSVPEGFTSGLANLKVYPTETTTYTLVETITATGCSNSNSVVVTVYPKPKVTITNPAVECFPATVDLTAAAITAESTTELTYTYWTDPAATIAYGTPASATSGTYYIKGETWIGCFDIQPVTVAVEPPPTITITTPATCSANLQTYSVGLTVSSGIITTTSGTAQGGSNNVWSIKGIPSGTNIDVTLTDDNCTKTIAVTAPDCNCPVIAAPVSGGDKNYCSDGSVPAITATVSAGETVDWFAVPTGGIALATGVTSFTPAYAGTYYAETRNSTTNCKSSSRTAVTITMNSLPSATAGDDKSICVNTGTTIGATAVSGSTYHWSSVPAGFSSTLADPSVTPLVNTTYTLVETITATGCTNTQSVVLTVKPLPDAVAGADRTICSNTSTTIGAAPVTGSTYSWSSSPAGFTSAEANPVVNPLVTTTYTVIETNTASGCSNTHNIKVTVNPLPAAVAGTDKSICPGAGAILGAESVSGSTYSWTSEPSGFSSTEANPAVNPLETTKYTVTETITATGCINTQSVVVTVNPLPAAAAGADRSICLNSNTTLGAPAVAGSIYSWTSSPSESVPTIAEPVVNPLVTTTYTLTETVTATGCTNTHSVKVTVNPLTGPAGPITGPETFIGGASAIAYSVAEIENASSYVWTYTGTGVTINGTGKNVTLDFSATASGGSLIVKGNSSCGDGVGSTLVIGDTKTLNLSSVILEGIYAGGGTMNQVQDENGAHWPTGIADHVTVELRSASNYGTIIYTAADVPLSTTGTASVIIPGVYNGSYYITINHRNSIETASSTAISFAGSTVNQSFSNPADVYGGNLRQKNGGYAIHGGDANKDGVVDLGDMNETETDATAMLFGYYVTDVNGDGIVDMSDMNLIEVNATDMIMVVLP